MTANRCIDSVLSNVCMHACNEINCMTLLLKSASNSYQPIIFFIFPIGKAKRALQSKLIV